MRRGNFIFKNIHLRTRRRVLLINPCVEVFFGGGHDSSPGRFGARGLNAPTSVHSNVPQGLYNADYRA